MPLWSSSADATIHARGRDEVQLLALPQDRRAVGLLPIRQREDRGHPQATAEYVWGDKTLRTIHCRTCGCVTHWEPLEPKPGERHGVNLGNFDPKLIAAVR